MGDTCKINSLDAAATGCIGIVMKGKIERERDLMLDMIILIALLALDRGNGGATLADVKHMPISRS